jgi:hypothetical protein
LIDENAMNRSTVPARRGNIVPRDGRIDDPKAGWKGRGVWSAYGGRATNHIDGGKGTKPMSFEVLVDESIVRELDKSGFIEKIYKK